MTKRVRQVEEFFLNMIGISILDGVFVLKCTSDMTEFLHRPPCAYVGSYVILWHVMSVGRMAITIDVSSILHQILLFGFQAGHSAAHALEVLSSQEEE